MMMPLPGLLFAHNKLLTFCLARFTRALLSFLEARLSASSLAVSSRTKRLPASPNVRRSDDSAILQPSTPPSSAFRRISSWNRFKPCQVRGSFPRDRGARGLLPAQCRPTIAALRYGLCTGAEDSRPVHAHWSRGKRVRHDALR